MPFKAFEAMVNYSILLVWSFLNSNCPPDGR